MFLGELPVTGVYMEHNTGRNISDNKACASGTKKYSAFMRLYP